MDPQPQVKQSQNLATRTELNQTKTSSAVAERGDHVTEQWAEKWRRAAVPLSVGSWVSI